MNEQIRIKVERESPNPSKPFIKVYESVIDVDSSIVVPYQTIIDTFRFIYGHRVVVSISSSIIK